MSQERRSNEPAIALASLPNLRSARSSCQYLWKFRLAVVPPVWTHSYTALLVTRFPSTNSWPSSTIWHKLLPFARRQFRDNL